MGSILCTSKKSTLETVSINVNVNAPTEKPDVDVDSRPASVEHGEVSHPAIPLSELDETHENVAPENPPEETTTEIPQTDDSFNFVGIYVGCTLYCTDVFVSKYTHNKMQKWRKATIVEVSKDGFVKVHFDGWGEKHDVRLNLHNDIHRLAPENFLSDAQLLEGYSLSEDQLMATSTYFLTGMMADEGPSSPAFEVGQVVRSVYLIARLH